MDDTLHDIRMNGTRHYGIRWLPLAGGVGRRLTVGQVRLLSLIEVLVTVVFSMETCFLER